MGKIKKSVSLSVFEGTESSPMLFMGELEKNIPLIAELGYDGVDLFLLDHDSKETKKAIRLLKEYNLGIGMIMPAGMAGQGLFLGDPDESIRREIVKKMTPIIELASEVGGMVSLGLVRGGVRGNDTKGQLLERFAHTTEKLLMTSEHLGVPLLIEPINRYEIDNLNSSQEVLEFIQKTGLPLYLMLDTFHMNIEDVSIEESFRECRKYVKHIHFLDSNRLAPGMGHLDMNGILKVIQETGYEGYLCLEALRKPDGKTVAEKGMEFFHQAGLD